MAKAKTPKAPMVIARRFTLVSSAISDMARAIDSGEVQIQPATIDTFKTLKLDLRQGVDDTIEGLNHIDGMLEQARAAREFWNQRVQKLKTVQELARKTVLDTLKAKPNIPYTGLLGELAIQKNGGKLPLTVDLLVDDRSFSNVLRDGDAFEHGIDEEFIDRVVISRLNRDAVRAHLEAGGTLKWARLEERGTRLFYTKPNAEAIDVEAVPAAEAAALEATDDPAN